MKKLSNMVFDAGGPFLLIAIIGIPIFLGIVVIAVIVVTIRLIIKANKKKKAEQEESPIKDK